MLFEELLKDLKKHRDDMVARNYPFQQLSNLIVKYEDSKKHSHHLESLRVDIFIHSYNVILELKAISKNHLHHRRKYLRHPQK